MRRARNQPELPDMKLSDAEQGSVAARAAQVEARTGVEVVVAVIDRCDAYPEAPWKAFALCTALAALAVPLWPGAGGPAVVAAVLALLGTGAVAALATALVPPLARLFVDAARRETEARQYATSFFLGHGLGATRRRNAILVLVGLFERAVVILPDTGLQATLGEGELKAIIARIAGPLAAGRIASALGDGLDALEALLVARGHTAAAVPQDGIAREFIRETGA